MQATPQASHAPARRAAQREPAAQALPVSAVPAQQIQRLASACACGGGCPRCASTPPLVQREAGDAAEATTNDVAPGADEAEPLTGNPACPVDAVFSSNVAGGNAKSGCQVPQGQSGASRLAQYIVRGTSPVKGLSIDEQFTAIEDPYSVIGALTPVTNTTDASGRFDDCYMFATKSTLPTDFRLKVAQNHLLNGQAISKNVITFTAGNVDVRHCKRKAGSCDFSDVCRLA